MSHKKILDNLEKRVRNTQINGKEEEYGSYHAVDGEIDYYMYDPNSKTMWVFEVKSNFTPKAYNKAICQLYRVQNKFITRFPFRVKNLHKYFVTKKGQNPDNLFVKYLGGVHYEKK